MATDPSVVTHTHGPLEISLVPILQDNYAYLVRDVDAGVLGVVDPGDGAAMERAVNAVNEGRPAEERGLDWILLTHHHADHIDGAERLASAFGAKMAGAAADAARLPKLDEALSPGVDWQFGAQIVEILDAPGHTVGHIAFHFPRAGVLFAGDSLFALGCGRLFEGTAAQAWGTIERYAALAPETAVYAGHEYTLANARFAMTIEKDNAALADRVTEIEALRAAGTPTLPTTIGREHATNPFMRAGEPTVKAAVGLPGADAAAVFAEVRRRKDAA